MSASSSTDKTDHVDLTKLGIDQLMQIKQEFEQEINSIQESLQTLISCKGKYTLSKEALESFQPESTQRDVLVPLTSSMYVPGRIKDMDNFMIDVGTGYYVEQNLEGSKDYFVRRIDYVREQIEKIEKIQMTKTRFLNAVIDVIEMKQSVAAKQQQQQQQAAQ